jgi:DNA-binding transcriptional ArsR family regulator
MKRGKPSLTELEADRVRAVMRRLLAERFAGNRTKLAEAIGLSQPAVSQLIGDPEKDITPKNRPGERTARVVAKMAGMTDLFWENDSDPEELASRAVIASEVASRTYEADDLPYSAERERAVGRLVVEHGWKLADAIAGVRALLAFAHDAGVVTDDHFVQGAIRSRAAMRGKTAGERVAKGTLVGVVDEGQVGDVVGGVLERGAELGAALSKKKGKHRREDPRSVRKIKTAAKPNK